ncbi:MAG: hypothetical protein WBQ60_09430 [Asticcacaulis sp.]
MSKALIAACLSLSCLLLVQCKPAPEAGKSEVGKSGTAKPNTQGGPDMGFDVKLSFTPAALSALKAADDNYAVDASYYAYPTETSMSKANRLHQLELGDEEIGAYVSTTQVHITGNTVDRSLLTDIKGPAMVLVRAYSIARVGNETDRLSCNNYRDTLERAQSGPVTLSCDIVKP